MRGFWQEVWRLLAPFLFVVGMPFVLFAVGAGMVVLGKAIPWDLMVEAGIIVSVVGVVWIGILLFRLFFSD